MGYGRRLAPSAGISTPWSVRGPCQHQRYLELGAAAAATSFASDQKGKGKGKGKGAAGGGGASAGEQLAALRDELFLSDAFARYLSALTGLEVTHARVMARRFRAGLDFSKAAACGASAQMSLDATLCFIDDQDDEPETAGDEAGGCGKGRAQSI